MVDFSTGVLRSLRHMQRHALGQLWCSRGQEKILDQPEIKTPHSCRKGHSILVSVRHSACNIKVYWKSSLPNRKVPKPKVFCTPILFLFCSLLLCWCSTFLPLLQKKKYHEFGILKQYPFILSQVCRSKVHQGWLGSLFRVPQASQSRCLASLGSYLEAVEENLLLSSFRLLAGFSSFSVS